MESRSEQDLIRIGSAIDKRAKELDKAHLQVLIHAAPVFQCADALSKSIDAILKAIDLKQYREASDIGYGDLCSNFVWMQRTLGSLSTAAFKLSDTISRVAGDSGVPYEQVKPLVDDYFEKQEATQRGQSSAAMHRAEFSDGNEGET